MSQVPPPLPVPPPKPVRQLEAHKSQAHAPVVKRKIRVMENSKMFTYSLWDVFSATEFINFLNTKHIEQNFLSEFNKRLPSYILKFVKLGDEFNHNLNENNGLFIHFELIVPSDPNNKIIFHYSFHNVPKNKKTLSNRNQSHIKIVSPRNISIPITLYETIELNPRITIASETNYQEIFDKIVSFQYKSTYYREVYEGLAVVTSLFQELIINPFEEENGRVPYSDERLSGTLVSRQPSAQQQTHTPIVIKQKYLKYKQKYLQLKKQLELEGKLQNLKI